MYTDVWGQGSQEEKSLGVQGWRPSCMKTGEAAGQA